MFLDAFDKLYEKSFIIYIISYFKAKNINNILMCVYVEVEKNIFSLTALRFCCLSTNLHWKDYALSCTHFSLIPLLNVDMAEGENERKKANKLHIICHINIPNIDSQCVRTCVFKEKNKTPKRSNKFCYVTCDEMNFFNLKIFNIYRENILF